MENDFAIWKTQLLSYVTDTKKIVAQIKEMDEIRTNLRNKAELLEQIANDLRQYANELEGKILTNELIALDKKVNSLSKDDLLSCRDVLMRLITVNLPEQLEADLFEDRILIKQYVLGGKKRVVCSNVCTIEFSSFDKGIITIDVKFDNYPKSNKPFNLDDFKKMYSVVEYIILVLGYGKTLE